MCGQCFLAKQAASTYYGLLYSGFEPVVARQAYCVVDLFYAAAHCLRRAQFRGSAKVRRRVKLWPTATNIFECDAFAAVYL
eukprot:927390-Lingulodinium_polyedra.AAC.1